MTNINTDKIRKAAEGYIHPYAKTAKTSWLREKLRAALSELDNERILSNSLSQCLKEAKDEIDRLREEFHPSYAPDEDTHAAYIEQRTKEACWERLEHEIDGRLKYLTPLLFNEIKRAFRQAIDPAEIT